MLGYIDIANEDGIAVIPRLQKLFIRLGVKVIGIYTAYSISNRRRLSHCFKVEERVNAYIGGKSNECTDS